MTDHPSGGERVEPPAVGDGLVRMAYAWPRRPSEWQSLGAHHIVVTEKVDAGRLHRAPGDALCKPASKFRNLDTVEGEHRRRQGQKFDCLTCLVHNERLGLIPATECGEPRLRSGR